MLLLLKIAITPLLVAAVSLVARRWGPTVGGILMGLPWFTGPVLAVLVLDRGAAFGAAACVGIELGVVCIAAFLLAYGLLAAVAGWPLSLAGAAAAFLASALILTEPSMQPWLMPAPFPPLWTAAGLGVASLGLVLALLPRPRAAVRLRPPPWWDIPARIVAAAALVTAVLLSAETLGPRLAGVFATFPVIVTVVGSFTHHQSGHHAVRGFLRGVAASLIGFVAFFLIVGLALPSLGLIPAYALAVLASLAMTAVLLAAHRARHIRALRAAAAHTEARRPS
jgi:hypothetical protein